MNTPTPTARPSDNFHGGNPNNEVTRQATEIAAMAEDLSLFAVHLQRGFMLRVTLKPPNGKAVRFVLHADERQQKELFEALEEILTEEEILPEEGITSELVDEILAQWYTRLSDKSGGE